MNAPSPEQLFTVGKHLLESRQYREALLALKQASRLEPEEARYRSLYGLCLVLSGRNREEGLRLCRRALQQAFYDVDLYVNLAEAHLAAGDRRRAVAVLRKATTLEHQNRSVHRLLRDLGKRRRRLIPFLRRGHPVNRIAGRLRHTLLQFSGDKRKP